MNEWKKIIFYAIIPALIAGIFAVAPKIYEEFTAPQAILSYQVVKSPTMNNNSIKTIIYSINTNNDGEKQLNDIVFSLKTTASINEVNLNEKTGIKAKINKEKNEYYVLIERLHPKEGFNVSLMLTSNQDEPHVEIILRSKETLGVNKDLNSEPKRKTIDFIGAVLAGISVFFTGVYFLSTGQKILLYFYRKNKILFSILSLDFLCMML